MNKKKIALLTRSIADATGREMWRGIAHSCREAGIPLITFRGGNLHKDPQSILYYLLKPQKFSGIITWASSDAEKATVDYYNNFSGVPLLGMSFQIPGHPVVLVDCTKGMEEIVEHFITVHGYKKIAFARGPENHVYAKERYETYLETLKKHNITPDPNLITPPSGWAINHGYEAIDYFIDKKGLVPGRDFDAILAVGDNVAIGISESLQQRGYKVPQDVAVGGFNGIDDAKCTNPPLTSVLMPFWAQGKQGFDTLNSMMKGEKVPEQYRYATSMILGQSCGCVSESILKASTANLKPLQEKKDSGKKFAFNKKKNISMEVNFAQWREESFSAMANFYKAEHGIQINSNQLYELIDAFKNDITKQSKELFLQKFNFILDKDNSNDFDIAMWHDMLSLFRSISLSYFQNTAMIETAESLWQQSRVMISELNVRKHRLDALINTRKEKTLRLIGANLTTSNNVEKLMNTIASSVGELGIPSCYVIIFENSEYTPENKKVSEQSRIMCAVRDGKKLDLPAGGRLFKTKDCVPEDLLPQSRYYSLVVESLHFNTNFLGYIVYETGPEDGTTYSALAGQIASSLYAAYLLKHQMQLKNMLQETLQNMSGKADVVSAQSEKISGNVGSISSTMEEVAASFREVSIHIQNVTNLVEEAQKVISTASNSMVELSDSSSKIVSAVDMINDIAEKTNVLALNAAIEAAHAGEAGRGFSVVAKEVKALAAQTVASTQSIQDFVDNNLHSTEVSKESISKTTAAIKKIADYSQSIVNAIKEQVAATNEVSTLLIDASTGTNEISNAILEIANLGDNLKL
ncbi:MAG: substrate-binding domain-containing protein [Treponema sp.]|nr:substrate-binding domain-containing protein [Treponema sp.]